MKTLILIRHANALSTYEAGVTSDRARPLSDEGREKAAQTARALKSQGLKPQIILTSPLLRAVETAEILSAALSAPVSQETLLNGLYSDAEVRDLLLEQLETYDTVAAVGHNPAVAYVTHLLSHEVHAFAPGSFAVMTVENEVVKLTHFGE